VNNGSAICGFDPQIHPIGYALVLETTDVQAVLEAVGAVPETPPARRAAITPDLFGWEIDPAA
jgi:hypothetical protein